MTTERMPSVYETPRTCLPCGREFIPPRRPGLPPADHCSADCRHNYHRRSMSSPFPEDPPAPEPESLSDRPPYARRMIQLRSQRGWHQDDLARRLGAHRNSVVGWEKGHNTPGLVAFAAIADVFEVTLDYLYGRNP